MEDRAFAPAIRSTRREDWITVLTSLWLIIGVFVDAYKHSTDPGLESFWTPWHALFYSGFLASSGWLIALTWRRWDGRGSFVAAAPLGHRPGLYGIGIFALGGAGDAVWHELLGVETSLDALLSPTHLLLFIGALAITSTPLRAAWLDGHGPTTPTLAQLGPALMSVTLATSFVAFFFEYAWAPASAWAPRSTFVPDGDFGELPAAYGVISVVVTVMVLMGPLLLLARRWTLPFGFVTVFSTTVTLLITVGFDEDPAGLLPAFVAGATGDLLLLRFGRRAMAAGMPFVLLASFYGVVAITEPGIGWPPEIWGGAIFFGVLTAVAIEGAMTTVARLAGDRPTRQGDETPPGEDSRVSPSRSSP